MKKINYNAFIICPDSYNKKYQFNTEKPICPVCGKLLDISLIETYDYTDRKGNQIPAKYIEEHVIID